MYAAPAPPPPAFALRPAAPADAHALHQLEQRCFTLDRLSRRQLAYHVRNPHAVVLAATRAQDLIGAAVVLTRARSTQARLYSLAVDPEARGLGVGAALLYAAEAAALARGASALVLEVRLDNPAAVGLYTSRGYTRVAQLPDYYADGTPAWRFRRSLRPGGAP